MSRTAVLVTGGAGFIGAELVHQLVAQGIEVVVVDNLVNGRRENLNGLPADEVWLEQEVVRNWEPREVKTDEVITVSHSFIATANSIRYCGATPVFVDIQPETFNMDPALIENVILSTHVQSFVYTRWGCPVTSRRS